MRVVFIASISALSSAAAANGASAQASDVGPKMHNVGMVLPTKLKLASGLKVQSCWRAEQGFSAAESVSSTLLTVQGYVQCNCLLSMEDHCGTVNDNPSHPSCSGFCLDSELKHQPCQMQTLIGPPKDD